jgi:hypothetical protein
MVKCDRKDDDVGESGPGKATEVEDFSADDKDDEDWIADTATEGACSWETAPEEG